MNDNRRSIVFAGCATTLAILGYVTNSIFFLLLAIVLLGTSIYCNYRYNKEIED